MRAARACASARPAGAERRVVLPLPAALASSTRSRRGGRGAGRASLRTVVAASRASSPLGWRGGAGTRGPWLPGHGRHVGHRAGYRAGAGAAGARVAVVGRDADRAAAVAAELEATRCAGRAGRGGRPLHGCGLRAARWPAASERFGGLDVLVNNVGTARTANWWEVDDTGWMRSFELNVLAYVRCTRSALPHLRASDQARIVNVASTSGKRPSTGMPDYSVTKAAVLSFSRLLADAHAREGILVNAVCPGPDADARLAGARRPGRPERRARRIRSRGSPRRRRRGPSAGPSGRARGDRERDRISVLGPRELRHGRGLERRRRHRADHHLGRVASGPPIVLKSAPMSSRARR